MNEKYMNSDKRAINKEKLKNFIVNLKSQKISMESNQLQVSHKNNRIEFAFSL